MGDRRGDSYVQESQPGGAFVPVGSCPVFHTESGYLGGILMAGFVSTSLCLDHWILGIRDVKALLQQSYSQVHQSLCVSV